MTTSPQSSATVENRQSQAQGASGSAVPHASGNSKILEIDPSITSVHSGEESLLESLQEAESIRDLLKYDKEDPRSRGEQARDAMLTMELAYQQGVAIKGDVVSVPGRVSLTPYTILLLLLVVITNLTTTIHFRFIAPNFLFTAPVITLYMIGTIFVYHTAYRAQRIGVQLFVMLCTIIFTALVDWGYMNQIIHNEFPALNFVQTALIKSLFGGHFMPYLSTYHENHFLFLIAGLISFNLIFVMLVLHFLFLGRGTRNITVKNKNTR